MSGQKYKRTNFEEDDNVSNGGTPPGVTYDPSIAFKAGASFWQKRTILEKLLLSLSAVLAVVVIILGIVVGTQKPQRLVVPPAEKKQKTNLCTTLPCVTVASAVLNSMDPTADPCDDFYQYACGGWTKAHPIPSGQSRWGTFSVMDQQNQVVIKNELASLGAKPLLSLLKTLGGWQVTPGTGSWDIANFDIQSLIEMVHSYGMGPLFYMGVGEDEKDTEHNILQFDESGLGLARDQYLNKTIEEDKTLSGYLKYMTDIGVLLGGSYNETKEQMYKVIEFEQKLANITTPMEDRRDDEKLYHKITVRELQNLAPFLDWLHYINSQLNVTTPCVVVDEDEKILTYAPEYLEKLTDLLTDLQKTEEDKIILNNYLIWNVVRPLVAYLSKPFQNARKEFLEILTGVSGEEELWRYCTSDTNSVLGFAVGAMFVRKTFHGESKNKAEEMISDIKQAFKKNLANITWMDEETKRAAADKADAVVDMIGFPPYILNTTALNEKYDKLFINESEYFQNNIRVLKFSIKKNLDKLRKPPERQSWSMTPATVNAYYTPTRNEIVFPAGILQAPFFDQKYPKSLNYGGMGVVMGHELTHGFDDQGREYDKYGVLRPWWNQASIEKFKERSQCVVDQYSNYKINGDHIKGKQTLGENIADNGGLKAAFHSWILHQDPQQCHYAREQFLLNDLFATFHAYSQWISENGQEPSLPGVNLTDKQLFFLAFAQVWCSNSKPESVLMGLLTDPHSPSRYRVIGPLSNSKDFATEFHCKSDSYMNPAKKCEVW
ncbi:hypothetical protein LSH36_477g02015 [Paralvinella palmiformis]|uniref:Endothelin-converting enzyme 1 n=1 Tax=Paralvinella palmiformis TaxID=53620 RepID=A0AAD9J9S8_9ANNE|nr:hypothetical protein LSH36_477g02015 [Paralvinella palmiformis]